MLAPCKVETFLQFLMAELPRHTGNEQDDALVSVIEKAPQRPQQLLARPASSRRRGSGRAPVRGVAAVDEATVGQHRQRPVRRPLRVQQRLRGHSGQRRHWRRWHSSATAPHHGPTGRAGPGQEDHQGDPGRHHQSCRADSTQREDLCKPLSDVPTRNRACGYTRGAAG